MLNPEKEKKPIISGENKIVGGRKFWHLPEEEVREMAEKNEYEKRMKKLEIAIAVIKDELKDEMRKVRAIIVYGSTGREKPSKVGDIDIHIDLDPYNHNVFKKIIGILEEQFPDIEYNFTSKNITEGGRVAKLITAQKFPNEPAGWKFLYSRSEQEESELNRILSETQKQKR